MEENDSNRKAEQQAFIGSREAEKRDADSHEQTVAKTSGFHQRGRAPSTSAPPKAVIRAPPV
jgi:hypothetical protein